MKTQAGRFKVGSGLCLVLLVTGAAQLREAAWLRQQTTSEESHRTDCEQATIAITAYLTELVDLKHRVKAAEEDYLAMARQQNDLNKALQGGLVVSLTNHRALRNDFAAVAKDREALIARCRDMQQALAINESQLASARRAARDTKELHDAIAGLKRRLSRMQVALNDDRAGIIICEKAL
jgi:hypothetical protein